MIKVVVTAWMLAGSLLAAPSSHSEMVPARFGSFKQEFIERLTVPALNPGDELLMRCGANVHPNGNMTEIACLENVTYTSESQKLLREIVRVARFVRISPAIVDDRETLVWMNFALRVRQSDGGQDIEVFEHHLMNVDTLGMDYISAQRFDKGRWGCPNTAKGVEMMRAKVDAAGQIHDVQVSTIRITQRCADRISEAVRDSRYIPAMVNGVPVDSMYYEMFYWR